MTTTEHQTFIAMYDPPGGQTRLDIIIDRLTADTSDDIDTMEPGHVHPVPPVDPPIELTLGKDSVDDMDDMIAGLIAQHHDLTSGDYDDLLGSSEVGMLWATRIRTWNETDEAWPERSGGWIEPSDCICRYPHGYYPKCRVCTIEYMAKARRTWNPDYTNRKGDVAPRWVYDADGEFGAHYQSSEIRGLRAHVVHYPTHGVRQMGTWLLVVTEFLYEQPMSFVDSEGHTVAYTQRAREVIGFQECFDRDEGILQAQELVEQWRITDDNLRNGWDNITLDEVPMEAAVMSPEMIERLADQPGVEIIA
jgi:hypothetical protein